MLHIIYYLCVMSKVVALDFGLKRTGIALSDEARMFAFGHETIASDQLMNYLKKLVSDEKITTIVLGLPSRLDTTDSHISENVRLLSEALKKEFPLCDVQLLDERFTSKMASQSIHMAGGKKKHKKDKMLVDKVSATIILQSYLEQQGRM